MKYKMILFDLDGTLLNSLEDLAAALNYSLITLGLKERTLEEVRCFVGNGIKNLCIKGSNNYKSDEVYKLFREYYDIHYADKSVVYDGILELLDYLKDFKLGIISNKKNDAVKKISEAYFKNIFNFTLGETEGLEKKPAPDMMNYVLDKYNLKTSEVLYIGDSDVDIKFAQNSLCDYIIVDYGFRTNEELQKLNPKILLHTPLDIIKYIDSIKY